MNTLKRLALLMLAALALATAWMCEGCGQLIVDRTDGSRLKINTLFMSTGLDGLYHDAEFTEIAGYKGVSDNLEIQYNPYTGVKLKTLKGNEDEG